MLLTLLISACNLLENGKAMFMVKTPVPTPTAMPVEQLGVHEVIGSIYRLPTNYYEKYGRTFVLYDLNGFLEQDIRWKMAPEDMVVAHMVFSENKPQYRLNLPLAPTGYFHDVDNNDKDNAGVQIYTYMLAENYTGSDYIEKTEQNYGFPYADLAVTFTAEDVNQLESGWLLVWAQDNQQMFPVDVGPDGVLFSQDDLVEPLLPGYTSIYLENGKLKRDRSPSIKVSIRSPLDQRQFDLSHREELMAYDEALLLLEQNYPEWDSEAATPDREYLQATLREKMKQAVEQEDDLAILQVYGEMVTALNNVGIQLSGPDQGIEMLKKAYPADFGFLIGTMDDGLVRVTEMRKNSLTIDTNLSVGDIVVEVNGIAVDEAIEAQTFAFLPQTNLVTTRKLKELFLLRKPDGEKLRLKVRNMLGQEESYTLTSTLDTSLMEHKLPEWFSEYRNDPLPIAVEQYYEYGVIHVYDMDHDPALTVQMFDSALLTLEQNGVNHVIINLQNARGTKFLHLAGFFTEQEVDLATYKCKGGYSQAIKLQPASKFYSFPALSAIIGSGCRGACELEALAFQKLSNYRKGVFGAPTFGKVTVGYQAEIKLPGDYKLTFPVCQIDTLHKNRDFDTLAVTPQVYLPNSFYRSSKGNQYWVDLVNYSYMDESFIDYSMEDMRPLTIGEIQYFDSGYSINRMVDEDEDLILRMHDIPSYDLHAILYGLDGEGFFEYEYCEDAYEQMEKIKNNTKLNFFVDGKQLETFNIMNWYYQSNDYQHCNYWVVGVKDFPVGHHIFKFQVDVTDPVLVEDSWWQTGQYDFNYHLYVFGSTGED
jgi:C-terminal processing protease CtpA/Prc